MSSGAAREVEQRSNSVPVKLQGDRTVVGYGSMWDKYSHPIGGPDGFIERVSNRCFAKSKADGWPGVVSYYDHDHRMLLGATHSGTMSVDVDDVGLPFSVEVPYAHEAVLESVRRGDVAGASIGFLCYEDDWAHVDGKPLRTLLSCRLTEISPTPIPAYPDTACSAALRSLARQMDCPYDDVVALSEKGELRALFQRSDAKLPVYAETKLGQQSMKREARTKSAREALLDTLKAEKHGSLSVEAENALRKVELTEAAMPQLESLELRVAQLESMRLGPAYHDYDYDAATTPGFSPMERLAELESMRSIADPLPYQTAASVGMNNVDRWD